MIDRCETAMMTDRNSGVSCIRIGVRYLCIPARLAGFRYRREFSYGYHRDGRLCACRDLAGGGVVGCGDQAVRSLMSAIAAHSRTSRMAATAESLSLYGPETASTFPVRESSLKAKSPRLVTSSSNVPVTVYIILGLGAPSVRARIIRHRRQGRSLSVCVRSW